MDGASSGVVSFFGVWKSRVSAEDDSLRMVASGVVFSLEEAEVIEGGATGIAGTGAASALGTGGSCLWLLAAEATGEGLFDVEGLVVFSRGKLRAAGVAPPGLLEGTVLLRCTLPPGVVGVPIIGLTGVGPASDLLLCLLDTDTLRRKLFHLPSALLLLLAFELERLTTVFDLLGVTGDPGTLVGLGTPDCTSLTVS
jgi:hypothetical protein